MRSRGAAWAALAVMLLPAAPAAADPVFEVPPLGKIRRGAGASDGGATSLLLEARMLGVLGADRLAEWPDLRLGVEPADPRIVALRAGGVLRLRAAPVVFVAQLDLAEAARPSVGGEALWSREPGAFAGALVDDLYVEWHPARAAQLVLGRARVPFSKQRQWDERDLPLGGVPLLVDRVAPDRRWGLLLHGDLGALSYATGAWEDLDALEPRAGDGDASAGVGGAMLAMAHVEWTPVAPIYGSNPVGKVAGGRGPLPTPRADPWHRTPRVSIGLGTLLRIADAGTRTDVSVSAHVKWKWLAVAAELLVGTPADGSGTQLGSWGEAHVTPLDKLSLSARAEWDAGDGPDGTWTAGGGFAWHATADRRNKIGLVGWVRARRDTSTGHSRREDAVLVLIQASL